MHNTIKRADVVNALEAADFFEGEDAIVTDYQGRWLAATGFGIKTEAMSHTFAFFTALGEVGASNDMWDEGDDDLLLTTSKAYNLACAGKLDSLGQSTLVYFPGWSLSDE